LLLLLLLLLLPLLLLLLFVGYGLCFSLLVCIERRSLHVLCIVLPIVFKPDEGLLTLFSP
jgi:hypothetical protein